MGSQRTIQNFLELQHIVNLGIPQAWHEYKLDQKNQRDSEFFRKLANADLAPGLEIKTKRGDMDVILRCTKVGIETAEWEKVRR